MCVRAEVDSPIGLAFIQRYPAPESASRLGPKRMAAFCTQHPAPQIPSQSLHAYVGALSEDVSKKLSPPLSSIRDVGRTPGHSIFVTNN